MIIKLKSKMTRLPNYDISLDDFDSLDAYSCVRLWASGLYNRVQSILRTTSNIQTLYSRSPNTFFLVKNLIHHAETCGISKHTLSNSKTKALYRGINVTLKLDLGHSMHDKGFMSTSKSKRVAKHFTNNRGVLFKVKVSQLTDTFKGIQIDDKIDWLYQEQEILLLPGTLVITKKTDSQQYTCEYNHSANFVEKIMSMPTPQIQIYTGGTQNSMRGGGGAAPIEKLAGHHLVFWRGINGRRIEILETLILPKDPKKALKYMQRHFRQLIAEYDRILTYIPEYTDLEALYAKRSTHSTLDKLMSYNLHCAIVNPESSRILTIHYRETNALFAEMFDSKRISEVETTIAGVYGGVASYTPQLEISVK